MYLVCQFRLRCDTSHRKGMKLISRLSLIDRGLTSRDAFFLCVCACELWLSVCACVQVRLVSSEPRRKSRRILEFWL